MTIGGLWDYINKHIKPKHVPQKSLAGYRVAIDLSAVAFARRATARKIVISQTDVLREDPDEKAIDIIWLEQILVFITGFLDAEITPVIVFDGEKPVLKSDTVKQRKIIKDKLRSELAEIREKASKMDFLASNKELNNRAITILGQLTTIPSESSLILQKFLKGLGLPTVQAIGDAERAASRLCAAGICAAVHSPDGDCFAHQAKYLLRGEGPIKYDENGSGMKTFNLIILGDILEELEVDVDRFVDACIVGGCDYNVQLAEKIRFATALKKLKEFGSVEGLKKKYNIEHLNYNECRDLFEPVDYTKVIDASMSSENFDLQTPVVDHNEHLKNFGLIDYRSETFACAIKKFPIARNFEGDLVDISTYDKPKPNPRSKIVKIT